MFEIAAKLRLAALQSACAAGGYFFRFAGKSNQKGATSLEEAILFLYGNCGGGNAECAFPRDVLRWSARALQPRRTQGHSLSRGGWLGQGCNSPRTAVGCQPDLAKHARTAPALCRAASKCVTCCRKLRRTDHRIPRWSPRRFGARRVCAIHCCSHPTRVSRRAKRGGRRGHPSHLHSRVQLFDTHVCGKPN
ncbi:MAG: hypothetical protein LBO63_07545 [Oscillospiraceae bacterium]|nr:hypothetical protein [Oscillospiraceae bacterium]